MTPSLLLLVLLLLRLHPAPACDNSISNLSCFYNFNRTIRCEWTTNRRDICSLQAHNFNFHSLSEFVPFDSTRSALEATDRPGLRRCTLHFHKKVWIMSTDVLTLNLSCVHVPRCLVTQYQPHCNIKLDALDAPAVNGSRLSWTKAKVWKSSVTLQYQVQWTLQHHSWADGWSSPVREEHWAELLADSLVLGQNYRARVRVRVWVRGPANEPSKWSEWSPTLSWASAVGRSREPAARGSEGAGADGAGLWTAISGVVFVLGLVLVLIWTSRVHWVYKMKLVKGAPLSSPTPSVLKTGWQPPLFSSDAYLTFFKPVDIIASVELLPPEPRPSPDEDPCSPSGPLCSSLSSFSNPMYSQLCPHPQPDPDPDPDLAGLLGDPGLDLLLLLSAAQQSLGAPEVCEYERVEAVGAQQGPGADRVRLTSVDSGVGSGEEVSQDSLHVEEHTVIGSSSVEDQPVVSTHSLQDSPGLLQPTALTP